MSTITNITYGYGIDQTVLKKIKNDKLIAFFKKHDPERYQDMIEAIQDNCTEQNCIDWMKDEGCDNSGEEGIYAIISNIMSQETNIRFQYEISEDAKEMAVMMPAYMPWAYNMKEKNCTIEELDKIFSKYLTELEVEGKAEYVSVTSIG